jgi:toluene monooxygenase system protein E
MGEHDRPKVVPPLPTWSHLAGARRRPMEYEVVSVGLHYHTRHPDAPWELDPDLFMSSWYRRFREGSPLRHDDWNQFRDPDAIIYRGYVKLQNDQEVYVEGLLDQHAEEGHDASLAEDWMATLARLYTPARYPRHALQMAAAYGGQMAPASTITNCFFFQCADEGRLTQRIAYRTAELRNHCPWHGIGATERAVWEEDPAWQGFRELLEKLLVAWDWGECFVAMNLVAKPALDEATLTQLGQAASRHGDGLLHLLCEAHQRDVVRSRRWTAALVDLAGQRRENRAVIRDWIDRWVPLADRAVERYLEALPGADPGAALEACRTFRASLGLA